MPPLRGHPMVRGFFEKRTNSVQYIVADPQTRHCAIIDPVLDFDPKSGATATIKKLIAHATAATGGWYGFGTAIKAWLAARPRDGMKTLREMYREWSAVFAEHAERVKAHARGVLDK
jgi:Phosphoenolpyruvate carboxylase